MHVQALKTPIVTEKDDLLNVLHTALPNSIPERSVIAVTSKIVSITEGSIVESSQVTSKDELVVREADYYIPRDNVRGRHVIHTQKYGLIVSSAGIDASNGNEHFVLWPKNPHKTAWMIHEWLLKTYSLSECGVLITDSRSMPLRRGAVGMTLALAGFDPIKDYRNTKDIFGRAFTNEVANIADGLSASAVFTMGEGDEQTPCALITDLGNTVNFTNKDMRRNGEEDSFTIPLEDDMYHLFWEKAPWKKGDLNDE